MATSPSIEYVRALAHFASSLTTWQSSALPSRAHLGRHYRWAFTVGSN